LDTVIDLDRVIDYIEEQLGESFAVDKVGERQIYEDLCQDLRCKVNDLGHDAIEEFLQW